MKQPAHKFIHDKRNDFMNLNAFCIKHIVHAVAFHFVTVHWIIYTDSSLIFSGESDM